LLILRLFDEEFSLNWVSPQRMKMAHHRGTWDRLSSLSKTDWKVRSTILFQGSYHKRVTLTTKNENVIARRNDEAIPCFRRWRLLRLRSQ
jgi:hypothetical protein